MTTRSAILALLLAGLAGCFGSRAVQRSFYVLHADQDPGPAESTVQGMVRVRDLDAESVYEKFQIVIRKSPWQLRYSGTNLWAVRPAVMVADIVQSSLQESRVFDSVTRELIEARPDFTLAGELHALEVYDADEVWYAHLAMTLRLSRFRDGAQLWRYEFDERKLVGSTEMAHAVRAMSELLDLAMRRSIVDLMDTVEGVDPPPEPGPAVGRFYEPEAPRPTRLKVRRRSEASGAGAEATSDPDDAPGPDPYAPFIIEPDRPRPGEGAVPARTSTTRAPATPDEEPGAPGPRSDETRGDGSGTIRRP